MIKNKIIVLVFIIGMVAVLLVASIFLLKKNSESIDQNRVALEDAAAVKVKITEVLTNLHLLDLGIRGYALVENKQIENAYHSAVERWPIIHSQLESLLDKQGFPLTKLDLLKDTVHTYIDWIIQVKAVIDAGKRKEGIEMINLDKGYNVWLFHQQLSHEINLFEDHVATEANTKYQAALRNSYLLQLLLFLLILPTLLYLAHYTIHAFRLSIKLLETEAEKNKILATQNEMLEYMVQERTQEIAAQNEEIISQNEEIVSQSEEIQSHNEQLLIQQTEIEKQSELLKSRNEQLEEAHDLIAHQKEIIESENLQLASDLDRQNKELLQTNHTLAERNNRMEQFGYMVSHNLRGPIARISGLTNIFNYAKSTEETTDLIQKINRSANELDQVVKGLSEIMQIQRLSAEAFSEVHLEDILEKTKLTFEKEIKELEVSFDIQFNIKSIFSLPSYLESIFYNLISNAIKYRHPDRKLVISISSNQRNDLIELKFTDNGLGFDSTINKDNLFGLYKRFHFHVEGRGIGLYLVKSQVEMLGGKIEVESKPSLGTTFKIFLPMKVGN